MIKKLIKIPYYLLVFGVMAIGLLILATLMPIPGNFKVKIVKSGSMEPAIRTGGLVFIRPAASYGVGDVITFGKDTKTQVPTTHRIVEESGSGSSKVFTTKGDANDAVDPSTTRLADVEGKVIFSVPYAGFILDFAKKPLGFILIVGIPALMVIFDELVKIWKEVQKLRRKKSPPPRNIGVNVLDLRFKQKEKNIIDNSSSFNLKTLSVLLIIFVPLIGLSSVSSTVSYYNQSESSASNTLQASAVFPDVVKGFSTAEEPPATVEETELPQN
jgi:signal peptidase I